MVLSVLFWMGFLMLKNKTKYIFLIIFAFLIAGCAKSLISLETRIDLPSIPMYGFTNERNFYIDIPVSDSLKLKWTSSANGSFSGAFPVRYGEHIFINDLSGRIYAYELQTGKRKGQLNFRSGAIYTSLVINRLQIIFAVTSIRNVESTLYFYDFSKGAIVYEIPIEGKVLTDLLPLEDRIVLFTEEGTVYSFDYYGRELWKVKTETRIRNLPSYSNRNIYFTSTNGELTSLNSLNGETIFKKKICNSFFCGTSIINNKLYTGDDEGILYSINPNDGSIIWKYDTGSRIMMTPVSDNNSLFIGTLIGNILSINIETGKLNWITDTNGTLNVIPLITQNYLILPDLNRQLFFIDKENGKISKTYSFEGRLKTTPVIIDNLLIIGYDDYTLAAYEIIK